MILRLCVVVPTFDNPKSISGVIKDIVTKTPYNVLVVDDGSEISVENCLVSFEVREAMMSGRVRLHRFDENRGKGAAIQYAIQFLVARGYTHMLTMDGDGQHLASEIEKLVDIARANPWDLVIGDRCLMSETVPGVSKFGRAFSNFWVKYQTGSPVQDSQSGFRLYPLFPLQTLKFRTTRYDFEIEVLIRLMWRGIGVRETEIQVIYPMKGERVTHFNKLWDNARISLLNTALVTISLMKSHRGPKDLALATGVGVFIGCTPFFGFQTLLLVLISVVLRLNVVALVLGSQISLPPMMPVLIFMSVYFGKQMGFTGYFETYFMGTFVTGLVFGIAVGVAVYAVSLFQRERKSAQTNWTGKTRGGRFGNGFLKFILMNLGLRWGYFCLYFIVPYFWLFAPQGRKGLNEYYSIMYPRRNWLSRQGFVLRHFYRFGQVLMDRVYQGLHGGKQFQTRPEGKENILKAMDRGGGLILLSAHLGGWDLAAALLGTQGFVNQIHLVEYQAQGLNFQKVKDKMNPANLTTVDSGRTGDAIFEIHQAIKGGACLGLMGDRPLGDRFELIPFLGKLAPFDVTPFRMAAAAQVPLLFTYGFKSGEGYYDFYARPASQYVFDPAVSREEQLYKWAEEYVRETERLVLRYPEQWFNFYPFWSALPVAPNGKLGALSHNHLLQELQARPPQVSAKGPDPEPNGAILS